MKKSYLILAAIASVALASCSNEEFVGDQNSVSGERPITFSFDVPAPTRAEGAAAATALDNQFIVYGEKSETADGAAPVTDGTTTHQLVFKNYVVEYSGNTAYTTTSNTKNWEYVGKTQAYSTNVVPQAGETQTIKYWDYSATNYVFTAFSAKQTDLSGGKVTITKTTAASSGNKVYDKGYTVTLDADADPTKLYFSDREVIAQGTGTDRDATNAYGGNVTLTFRNLTSQIRVAMFETIPGYSVELDQFYYANAASPAFSDMTTAGTDKFYANVPNLTTDKAASLTVTYYHEGTRQNQPKVAITDGTANNYLALGTNLADGTTLGADNVSAATYDKSDKSYTPVFPQESNDKNMKLKVDYTLKNATTGETIKVVGATAEVPAEYLQWKPNFKYTYIFKISDNTNGSTGGNVVGLYPITFDAIEIVAEDGQAEYITTVSEPSITTFGVKAGKYVHDGSEYEAGSDIYATIMDGSAVKDFTLGTDVNVYKVTTPDATNFPITEAAVAEALANPARITNAVYTCAVTDVTSKAANELTNEGTYYKKDANNKAPGDAGYVPTPAVKNTDYTIGATSSENTIADGVNIYTCTVTYTSVANAADLTTGTTYYKSDGSKNPGETGYVPTIAVTGTDYQVAPKVAVTNINADASTNFTAAPAEVTTVPGEDGIDITGTHALKLTGVKAANTTTAIAIEYIHEPDAFTTDGGKVYTFANEDAFNAEGTLYTTAACDVVVTYSTYTGASTATYYKKIVNMPGTKVYKVIRVQ